ncbi:4Fe-4S dicluster domain-containing protein [Denitratimonas sp. CY0512]|uniref:4Fe-4S dicluster domain-containing protein n=1 Tax=Denitratimonas sp. CY0512 TaxID=3131940 RepID=UPI0030ACCF4D
MKKEIPVTVEHSLYVSEAKIQSRDIDGRYQRLRKLATIVLLGMFYLFPWLTWDGHQAVLFDLPARRFYVFGLTFWPQDFIFLALLLIIAGLSLFFFTALAGRLWCGFACPQTVWTEIFIAMEQVFEGDRSARIRLDKSPWTREKILKRGSRHAAWVVFALWTGFTFVGFFTPIKDLAARFYPFAWGGWEIFWVLFYSLATWGNAGVLREQVCKYMCPYARFQSAMFDRNTLIISYDAARGEPRGPRKRGSLGSVQERGRARLSPEAAESALLYAATNLSAASRAVGARATTALIENRGRSEVEGASLFELAAQNREVLGDCIDCTLCVQVCPTGIDIRNGLQYECIACGACVDACNDVMDKIGYPRGLVRFTTHNALEGKPSRILRPRVLVYGFLLLALLVGWGVGVAMRSPLIVEVLHDRNALYRELADGSIENGYGLKLVNKTGQAATYSVQVQSEADVSLSDAPLVIELPAEQVVSLPVTLQAPGGAVKGRVTVEFIVQGEGQSADAPPVKVVEEAAFFGPVR